MVPTRAAGPTPATGRIAFVRDNRIWVMNADGSRQRAVTPADETWSFPDWSPSGGLIAHRVDRDAQRTYFLDPDTGGQRMFPGGGTDMYFPRWSPDGQWIAFATTLPDAELRERSAVMVVRPDGSGRRLVSRRAGSPRWLGTDKLIFGTKSGTEVVDVDGSNRRVLTTEFAALTPSADGARVLSMRGEDEGWVLYETTPDLRQPHRVYGPHDGMTHDWSQDREWIAIGRTKLTTPCGLMFVCNEWESNVWLVRRDGTGLRQLTFGKNDHSFAFGPPAAGS